MATTGDTLVGTGADNAGIGATAWTNPSRITADDASDAQCSAAASSHYLVGTNCGFAVPADATIKGVTVKVEGWENTVGDETVYVQLQDNGASLIGSSKSALWSGTSPTVYTYGGAADLWSATLTPTIVNSSNFGMRLWFTTGHVINVDYVKIAVEYELGGVRGCGIRAGGVVPV